MSLTSQMSSVSFTAVESNRDHGSICSLQTSNRAVSLTSLAVTCTDATYTCGPMNELFVLLATCYILHVEMLRTAPLITYLLAKPSAQSF